MRFANPEFLALLIVIPFLIWWYTKRQGRMTGTLRYSSLGVVKTTTNPKAWKYRHVLFAFRTLAIILLIIGFARPQSGRTEEEVITEGIDIMLAMDVSGSMAAEDFKPKNRLEAAKVVAADFIKGRRNDRIGMVVFAAKSFTQCPLTLDYGILLDFLGKIQIGMIEDGTAIGMGIATAVNRLRDSRAKSKVIILLTDGVNNRGELDPLTAARIAHALGIRIYTIGAGTRGDALYPVEDPFFGKRYVRMPVEIDEESLTKIANITGGKYFRATDRESLAKIFKEIDSLEKTKIEVKEYTRYKELFVNFLAVALSLVLLEIFLGNTKWRKIP